MSNAPRNKTDEEIEEISVRLIGQLDFHGWETGDFLQGDWDALWQYVDTCQSCGYYVSLGETDENGNCETCASDEWESIEGANDNDPD